jgi:hypothetical protein
MSAKSITEKRDALFKISFTQRSNISRIIAIFSLLSNYFPSERPHYISENEWSCLLRFVAVCPLTEFIVEKTFIRVKYPSVYDKIIYAKSNYGNYISKLGSIVEGWWNASLCLCNSILDTVETSKDVIRIGDDAFSLTSRIIYFPEVILTHPIVLGYANLASSIPIRETLRRFLKLILDDYTGASISYFLRRDGITTKRKDFFPHNTLNSAVEKAAANIMEELDAFIDTSLQDSEKLRNESTIFEIKRS